MACSISGCDSTVRGGDGLCNKHYLRERKKRLGPCSVKDCSRLQHSKGLCTMHLHRLRTRGATGPAEAEYATGSRWSMTSDGYVRLHRPDHPLANRSGWVLEHRMLAFDAGLIGIADPRHVHHKNENKTDNRLANFEILTQPEHMQEHGLARRLDPSVFIEMRQTGTSVTAIAEATGKNSGTVWRVLKRHGALDLPASEAN